MRDLLPVERVVSFGHLRSVNWDPNQSVCRLFKTLFKTMNKSGSLVFFDSERVRMKLICLHVAWVFGLPGAFAWVMLRHMFGTWFPAAGVTSLYATDTRGDVFWGFFILGVLVTGAIWVLCLLVRLCTQDPIS